MFNIRLTELKRYIWSDRKASYRNWEPYSNHGSVAPKLKQAIWYALKLVYVIVIDDTNNDDFQERLSKAFTTVFLP